MTIQSSLVRKLEGKTLHQEVSLINTHTDSKMLEKIKSKKGIEFSFAWLFSIIAGVFILFLAVYVGYKMISTSEYQAGTATAKEISIIFEPMETGLASGKSTEATLSQETMILNECSDFGVFGEQEIRTALKRGRGFTSPSAPIKITNKYVFSNSSFSGKKMYFFSKPFNFPYKVADIIVITSKEYCLINTPDFIKEDIGGLNLGNIKFERNCSQNAVKVCFASGTRCDSIVYSNDGYETGYIVKASGERLYFEGNLIYAGIFSSHDIYECNIRRLMKKAVQLALLYRDESKLLSSKCSAVSEANLASFATQLSNVNNSADLIRARQISKSIDDENAFSECRLW
mgnify:CR=1 FL=1